MNEVSALIKVMIEFVYSLYSLPCEDTMKCWQQSATQKRTLTRTSTLLALRYQTSSSQNCEKYTFVTYKPPNLWSI